MVRGVHTTIGLFSDINDAAHAVDDLRGRGYEIEDISAVTYESDQIKELNARTTTNEDIADDAVKGAGTGAVVGGLAAVLIAAVAVPGVGLLAAGPIVAALGGAAAGAAVGGAVGVLTGLGLDETQARSYDERLKSGDVLIAVSTNNDNDIIAENILRNHDGIDVHTLHNVDTTDTREGAAA